MAIEQTIFVIFDGLLWVAHTHTRTCMYYLECTSISFQYYLPIA